MKLLISILLLSFCWCPVSFSQIATYSDKCKLIKELLDTADQKFFNFGNLAVDSSITILDVDLLLGECSITRVGSIKLNIIISGEEYDRVKKEGIFSASNMQKNYFILTRHFKGASGFGIFHPVSNGMC